MSETTNKARSADKGDLVFDQFALADVLGNDYVTSARAMRVMRVLWKKAITEGVLASKCNERPFLHEWTLLINKLVELGYNNSDFSGHGTTKIISLTENGERFLEYKLGPKEPEPVAEEQLTEQATA